MQRVKAFFTGVWEFRQGFTTHYSCGGMQHSYDCGREMAHKVTLRRYED